MTKKKSSQELLDKVIRSIKNDIECGDLTVLEELLTHIPKKYLIGSLSEEEWGKYTKNVDTMYDVENESIYDQRQKSKTKAS